jgi:twinkle protein
MLMAGKGAEAIDQMWGAKSYRPDGIIAGTDMWDAIIEEETNITVDYPYQGLNEKTLGARRGELVTITAGSGVGKTQICREIAYHLLNEGQTIGYIALEENTKRTALGLMGLDVNIPLHIDKEGISHATLRAAYDNTVGSGRVYLYDHFGSLATDNLLNKVRYLSKGCGVGWIILDHLSIVVSGVDDGDERKAIDVIMTKLRSLCEETGIGIFLVSHLKKPSGDKGWEDGLQISLNSLRGSAGIAQLSDICVGVERNQQGENPDVSTIRVLKNRFTGDTGIATYLHYDKETGRMNEVADPNAFQDETELVEQDF